MHTTTYAAHRWLLAWSREPSVLDALGARVPAARTEHRARALSVLLAPSEEAAHEPTQSTAHAQGAYTVALARFVRTPPEALPRALATGALHTLPDEAFAAAHFEPRAGTLTLARDRLGLLPLYFARDEGSATLFVSPSPALLLAALGRAPAPNREQLLAFLGGVEDATRAGWLRHTERVRAGEIITFTSAYGAPSGRFYARALDDDDDDGHDGAARAPITGLDAVTAHARATLEAALTPYVPEACRASVLMSGGLDSTAVAALLATRQGRSREAPLPVVSMVSRELPWLDEDARIRQVEAALPIRAERCFVDASWPLRDLAFYALGWEHGPHPHPGAFAETAALRRAAHTLGARVVLTGLGAETAMGAAATEGVLGLLARRRLQAVVQERHALGWPQLARALGVALAERVRLRATLARVERDVQHAWRRTQTPAPWSCDAWLTRDARATLAAHERDEAHDAQGLYAGVHTLAARTLRSAAGSMHDLALQHARRVALVAGVVVAHPFLDARLWAQSLRIAPEWRRRGGYDKAALRLALRELLPAEVCWGAKHGTTEQLVARGLLRREAPRVLALLRQARLEALGIARPGALLRAYEAAREASDARGPGVRDVPPIALWRAVAAELWLRALETAKIDATSARDDEARAEATRRTP